MHIKLNYLSVSKCFPVYKALYLVEVFFLYPPSSLISWLSFQELYNVYLSNLLNYPPQI